MKRLLSVKVAAQWLGVSQATVYGLVGTAAIPHVRIGLGRGAIRIDEADLEAFIEGQKQQRTPEAVKPPASRPLKLRHLQLP